MQVLPFSSTFLRFFARFCSLCALYSCSSSFCKYRFLLVSLLVVLGAVVGPSIFRFSGQGSLLRLGTIDITYILAPYFQELWVLVAEKRYGTTKFPRKTCLPGIETKLESNFTPCGSYVAFLGNHIIRHREDFHLFENFKTIEL